MVPGQVVYVVKSQLGGRLGGGDACSKILIPWGWEVNVPQAQHKSGLGRRPGAQQRQGQLPPPPILAQRGHLRVTNLVGCGSLGLNALALDGVL